MIDVLLDGRDLTTKDVHTYLKSKLNIKGYEGSNLDALWDVLSTYDLPIRIKLIHRNQLLRNLDSYGEELIKVFEEARDSNPNIDFISE